MTAAAYATRADLYKYGLPRGVLGMQAREAASALASTDTIELDGHGFETDDPVLVRAAEGGSLPAPLVAGTTYYAIRDSDSTMRLAAAPSGGAINLTTDAVSMLVMAPLPYDDVLQFYSRFVDPFIPAHAVPFTVPYPVTVVAIVAQLAAKKLMFLAGHTSDSVDAQEVAATAQLQRWASGIPLRDANADTATTQTVSSVIGRTVADPRGWLAACGGPERLP